MWYSATKVGVMDIDMDHSNLDTMLQLYFLGQVPQSFLANIIDGLIRHYRHEEDVISRMGYEFPPEHFNEHVRLKSLLEQMTKDWQAGLLDGRKLAEDLRPILLLYISKYDVDLGDFSKLKKL